jgi:hypothetical protein
MNFFFLRPATKKPEDKPAEPPIVHTASPHNTNEGSEFLDDAIRTHDQPLMYTEESIAAGSPQYLL